MSLDSNNPLEDAHSSAKLLPVVEHHPDVPLSFSPKEKYGSIGKGHGSFRDFTKPVINDTESVGAPIELVTQPQTWRKHKLSILIMLIVMFLDNLTFSIVLPSLVYYLDHFIQDPGRSQFMMGVAVAINSAATFLFSPICGLWTDKRSGKECLLVTSFLILGGNLIYGFAQEYWYILVGRVIIGIGAGNQVVSQVYFSWVTTPQERGIIMAIVTLVGVLAVILGPAIGAAFDQVHIHLFGEFYIDKFTMPGYFSAACALITIILLFFFDESARPPREVLKEQGPQLSFGQRLKAYLYPPTSANSWGIWACIYLSFTLGVSFTVFETVATSMTRDFYNWDVKENGLLFALAGVEAIVFIVVAMILSSKVSDRALVLFSSIVLALFAIPFCPFDFTGRFGRGGYIPFWLFATGAAFSTLGFTAGSVFLLTLFSKMTEDSSQGIWMGYFNASRALSRIVAPLAVGFAYEVGGALLVFVPTTVVMFTGLWVNLLAHRSLRVQVAATEEEKQPLIQGQIN